MEIRFLGTGSAWCTPEYSCGCEICTEMNRRGEERTRTSIMVSGQEEILVDCGPDLRQQMRKNGIATPDAVLITHEHGDHYLGMDDLLAFPRTRRREDWTPIPVYATKQAWQAVETRFGYLVGSLVEKREAIPLKTLDGPKMKITPFKTFHGLSAPGAVGFAIEDRSGDEPFRIVYTSDFITLLHEPDFLMEPDVLIIQSHWLNEPVNNRPLHMSFQRAMDYIRRWRPRKATYLVHISAGDQIPGDPCNNTVKKLAPLAPLTDPATGKVYPIPRCQEEWQAVVDRACKDWNVPGPVYVAQDGLTAKF